MQRYLRIFRISEEEDLKEAEKQVNDTCSDLKENPLSCTFSFTPNAKFIYLSVITEELTNPKKKDKR
jgi:hypothetical protein